MSCAEVVVVAPGSEVSSVFRIQSGKLEIHIVNGAGKPVAGRSFVIHDPRTGFRTGRVSDAQGVLRIERIAAGKYGCEFGLTRNYSRFRR